MGFVGPGGEAERSPVWRALENLEFRILDHIAFCRGLVVDPRIGPIGRDRLGDGGPATGEFLDRRQRALCLEHADVAAALDHGDRDTLDAGVLPGHERLGFLRVNDVSAVHVRLGENQHQRTRGLWRHVGGQEIGLARRDGRDQSLPVVIEKLELDAHVLGHHRDEFDREAGAVAIRVDVTYRRPLGLNGDAQLATLDDVGHDVGRGRLDNRAKPKRAQAQP